MIRTLRLIGYFLNTKALFKKSQSLAQVTKEMQEKILVYPENYIAEKHVKRKNRYKVCVEENTTFQCAQNILAQGKKVAVLNFANPYKPGGDVAFGAMAQEECLCRSSNLIASLSVDYAKEHFYKWNKKSAKNVFSDRIIYSPNVCVIKSDAAYPKILEKPFL